MILSANSFCVPGGQIARCRQRSLSGGDPKVLMTESRRRVEMNGKNRMVGRDCSENLEALWDDGFGSQSAEDYYKLAEEGFTSSKDDAGPPRWFCPVSCGRPLKNSPLLLYMPGLDCLGLGLLLHEKALGKVFEVRCLHVPVQNRAPLEDLVQCVEEAVRLEHALSPRKPIYLVGDSFGGCLAISVAARNPTLDLDLGNFLPKDTLIWRLKLLKSAAAYANSHLQAVTAEVLVSKDQLLPSNDEAQRLKKYLQNCVMCILKGNDHKLLLKSDSNLLTLIKGSSKYRRTSYHDNMKDYIPPSMSEYRTEYEGHRVDRL
ncbi:putative alpha/Beta hydrolase [Helianthus debilis subsp. tardiflorus]